MDEILDFWFGQPAASTAELGGKMQRWYRGDAEMERAIEERFRPLVEAALRGELDDWARTPRGRVALILVLDQFTRTLFRDTPEAYAGDAEAQRLAVEALDAGLDAELSLEERQFLFMPLVHAEDLALQARGQQIAKRLFDDAPPMFKPIFAMGIEQTAKYHGLIERFGRFPHRNPILGRESTPEELEVIAKWSELQPPKMPAAMQG